MSLYEFLWQSKVSRVLDIATWVLYTCVMAYLLLKIFGIINMPQIVTIFTVGVIAGGFLFKLDHFERDFRSFRSEMYNHKNEMLDFRNDMVMFKARIEERFNHIDHKIGELDQRLMKVEYNVLR